MKAEPLQSLLPKLITLSAMASLLLGCTVLLGWYTHNTSLIQINPTFVAMQYNTALGFVLGGRRLIVTGMAFYPCGKNTWFYGLLHENRKLSVRAAFDAAVNN